MLINARLKMVITYTLNFMDKNALSYSANFGLIDDNVRVFICWAVAYSIPNSALSTYTVTSTVGPLAPYSTWVR